MVWLFQYYISPSYTQQQTKQTPQSTDTATVTEPESSPDTPSQSKQPNTQLATTALEALAVKGRAPKTNYQRTQFGDGWLLLDGCDMRNIILHRDMTDVLVNDACKVTSGMLRDPYTGAEVKFIRGPNTSDLVQIDHVVALSDAWQKGAQGLTLDQRIQMANDPLELLAVDGRANQAKADGDAATWLPANKVFRCQYVARQIAVKVKYGLWITQAEKDAMASVLATCPNEQLPRIGNERLAVLKFCLQEYTNLL